MTVKVYKTNTISYKMGVRSIQRHDKNCTYFNEIENMVIFLALKCQSVSTMPVQLLTEKCVCVRSCVCICMCMQTPTCLMCEHNHFTPFWLFDILVRIRCSFFLGMCDYVKIMSIQSLLSFLEKFPQDYPVIYKG